MVCMGHGIPTSGYYEYDTKQIYICDQRDKEEQEKTLYHEVGHWVWFNIYTAQQRQEWTDLRSELPTNLPMYQHAIDPGAKEDFAELFAEKYYYKFVHPAYEDLSQQITETLKAYKKTKHG